MTIRNLSGASTAVRGPGAVRRGGGFFGLIDGAAGARPLAVDGTVQPSSAGFGIGFRCAR